MDLGLYIGFDKESRTNASMHSELNMLMYLYQPTNLSLSGIKIDTFKKISALFVFIYLARINIIQLYDIFSLESYEVLKYKYSYLHIYLIISTHI